MAKVDSVAMQDYLKGIYLLGEGASRPGVSTTAIAGYLRVSPASATNMLKRMNVLGLVDYVPYKGAQLTEAGTEAALEMVRHHRLVETYLAKVMGVPWDEVHEEAEVLEHAISERLEDRMAALLGDPTADPHGHPIPSREGLLRRRASQRLWDVEDGQSVSVASVPDDRSEALRYLAEIGLRPGVVLKVVNRGPVEGPLFVRLESDTERPLQALSKELAEAVWVT
jgi:DtxR family transcriptional regulator, Mn-dependent transcriptional regulator